jgi:hypothetical protein
VRLGLEDPKDFLAPFVLQPLFEHHIKKSVMANLSHGQQVRLLPYKLNVCGENQTLKVGSLQTTPHCFELKTAAIPRPWNDSICCTLGLGLLPLTAFV